MSDATLTPDALPAEAVPDAAAPAPPPKPTPEPPHRQREPSSGVADADETAETPPPPPGEQPPAPPGDQPPPSNKRWYVVKVQSGREESIKDAIERRVKIEGLEEFFGQIIVPVERY